MKILIISLPRTGSSSLGQILKKKHNLKKYLYEPFNSKDKERLNFNENSIVVKTLIFQIPKNIKEENRIEWLISLTKEFDEVILLTRRDLVACSESWAYLSYSKKTKKFDYLGTYLWEPTPYDDFAYNTILSYNEDLTFISKNINVALTYYEDIFDINGEERLRKGNKLNTSNII
jgi:hypothetical protein